MRNLWVRLADAFWTGFESARAEAKANAQPSPLVAYFAGLNETEVEAMIAAALRGAHDEGVTAEKARVTEILQAPDAEELPQLAMFLVLGDATAVQATSILAKAENDASKRVTMMRAQQIEPAITTLH
jgi:hypothetical protein